MAGGCLSCFFAYTSVVLLGGRLYDVEASRCDGVIYKKVGDAVELPSCAPTKGVTFPEWKYGFNLTIAEKTVYENNQFKGRLDLNPTSFNLTVRQLTRQDSGVFLFISDVDGTQSETVTTNLKVYDPITKEPAVTFDSSWDAEKNSCTVSLTCSSTSDSSVTFSWTVKNETTSGSTMDYNVTPQDGDTGFTCTVSNVVSEKSKSITAKCSNTPESPFFVPLVVGVLCGAALIGLPLLLYLFMRSKGCIDRRSAPQRAHQKDSVTQPEAHEHVYASPLPGDDSIYHSIHGANDVLHVPANRYGDDAPLQPIQLGGLEGTSDYEEPDENSQHNNVNPDPAREVQRRQNK
ncbi:SLAM family member 9 isoform X1 [Gasterosteus aculeatus]